jgi:hypothetical protein
MGEQAGSTHLSRSPALAAASSARRSLYVRPAVSGAHGQTSVLVSRAVGGRACDERG